MIISFLFSNHADTLTDVTAFFNLVNHSNCVICIADNALSLAVKGKLLACKDILACAFAVSLKISCGADVCPLDIITLTKLSQSLSHSICKGLEDLREISTVRNTGGMLGIHIKASCTADNEKSCIRSRKNVAQVSK